MRVLSEQEVEDSDTAVEMPQRERANYQSTEERPSDGR
jgi:hypothetical protein